MASVFLSYSREDVQSAQSLAHALEAEGHSVWWDRRIKGGAQYSKQIDEALESAEIVVVLWSANSINSAWVRDEAESGRDSGRLLPVTIDGSRPPLGFRQYQTIELKDWRGSVPGAGVDELIDAVGGFKAEESPRRSLRRTGPKSPERRKLLAGAAALAVVGAGGGWWLYRREPAAKLPPEAKAVMDQAKQLMEQNSRSAQDQAIALYERAVTLAPNNAEAWGRLGVSCAVASHYRDRSHAQTLRAKAESAGQRALQLDSGNVYGELALAVAQPFIGHWDEWDRRMTRALAAEPKNNELLTYRAVMLQFEGRASESVPLYQRISEKPFRPAVYMNYLLALWISGRPVELDAAMNDAASLYPGHPTIWYTRFTILAFSGRSEAAVALLQNPEAMPQGVNESDVAELTRIARAIASRDPGEADSIMAAEIEKAHLAAGAAEDSIKLASALGQIDDAFMLADAYYFGSGFQIPDYPTEGSTFTPNQRQTRILFEPPTAAMRADRRFEPLVRRIGIDRYWRESQVQPDYRRSARA